MFFSLVLSIVGLFNSAAENRKAIVEDYPFRLCYYVTAALLFFFTSLLGVKDAFRKYIFKRKLQSTYLNLKSLGYFFFFFPLYNCKNAVI